MCEAVSKSAQVEAQAQAHVIAVPLSSAAHSLSLVAKRCSNLETIIVKY
jgi:hypothetical protein